MISDLRKRLCDSTVTHVKNARHDMLNGIVDLLKGQLAFFLETEACI